MSPSPPQTAARSVRKRLAWVLGGVLASCLAVVALVVASVWVEDRHPCENPDLALLPALQRVVSKPIVSFLSRQAEQRVQARADMLFINTGMTLEETLACFRDESIDLKDRRIHAYRLARVASPECIAALLDVLRNAPPEHKAFMAQLIGSTGNPAAKQWLIPLLDDPDPQVVIAAIRGLSAIGGDDVCTRIAGFLDDSSLPDTLRIEAARGLGTLTSPAANDALVRALGQLPPEDLAIEILSGLGRFDFADVEMTFDRYLSDPEQPSPLRVAAVEALSNSSNQAIPFLMTKASGDHDPEVRASAAWAISAHSDVHTLGPDLVEMAVREPEADVRRRLYEALISQSSVPDAELLPMVESEQDIAARVAGFNALGALVQHQPDSAAAIRFDDEFSRELEQIATQPNSLNIQMRAVFALRRASTPAARDALARIARDAPPQVAAAAQNGLKASHSP